MNINVDKEKCLNCGMCVSSYSDVFEWDEDGSIKVKDNVSMEEVLARKEEILEICPSGAIEIG